MDVVKAAQPNMVYDKSPFTNVVSSHVLDLEERILLREANQSGKEILFKTSEEKMVRCKDLYSPKTFSIGPFHYEMQRKSMTGKKKEDFLIDFLDRQGTTPTDRKRIFDLYLRKISELEVKARSCYWENIVVTQKQFSQILLVDGVFILEILLKHNENTLKEKMTDNLIRNVKRDFIVFENQIPFFILEQLLDLLYKSYAVNLNYLGCHISQPTVEHLAMRFFEVRTPPPYNQPNDKIQHLLDLFYRGFLPINRSAISLTQKQYTKEKCSRTIPSATYLKELGVYFEKGSNANFLHVDFQRGKLTIPLLNLDEMNMCIYANLVAFEDIKNISQKPITSLCYLFKSLIRNEQDLSILLRPGVIENIGGGDSDVRDFFDNICLDTSLDPDNHHLSLVFKKVQLYSDTKWHRWWAAFKRNFFRYPWSVVTSGWSLLAAAIVMAQFYWNVKAH